MYSQTTDDNIMMTSLTSRNFIADCVNKQELANQRTAFPQ